MNDRIIDRECPECGQRTGIVMHTDEVPCTCGRSIVVEYVACVCGYSWRSADGVFMDGCQITIENVEELLGEVEEFFEEQGVFEGANSGDSMEDLIHKCLQCGEIAIQTKQNLYECTVCGFSWEVDKFNE